MVHPSPANYSVRNAAIRIGCGRSTVYEFIDRKLLRRVKLKHKTLIPAADVERLIEGLHDGTLTIDKLEPSDAKAARNAAHRERMRAKRAAAKAMKVKAKAAA